MNITEATREGDAESNMMVDRDEDYNTRYGGYKGYLMAFDADEADPAAAGRDRPDGDGPDGRRGHGRRGRRSLRPAFPVACRWRTRTAQCWSIS